MKQNVSETEIGVFEKMQKHDHFHPILILPVKIVELLQQHANTTWFIGCKPYHYQRAPVLNVAEFLD